MLPASSPRPASCLWRVIITLLLVCSLGGVSSFAEQLLETSTHTASAGHEAHADARPECEMECSEHFCIGAMHRCGCCTTVLAVTSGAPKLPMGRACRVEPLATSHDHLRGGVRSRIDRPPRA